MPKISVIVPVYKVQPYVAECLKSLLSQTFRDIEVICVNDGSPDLSPVIVRKISEIDNRVKLINHPKNMGLSCARNTGLEAATGEYVHFMDSDDTLQADCYTHMWNLVSEHKFPELAIYHWKTMYDMFSKSLAGMSILETPDDKARILGAPYCVYKFGRIDFVRKFLFQPGNVGAEDVPWSWMTVLSAKSIPICPMKFYYYRKVATSLVHDRSMVKNKNLCVSFAITKQWLMRHGHWDELVYRNKFKQIVTGARTGFMLKHGSKDEVKELFHEFPILSDLEDSTDYLAYLAYLAK
jgi:glycosyltransferase involved in cell wall biosynthesis